jgi:hypothetical protein
VVLTRIQQLIRKAPPSTREKESAAIGALFHSNAVALRGAKCTPDRQGKKIRNWDPDF